MGVLVCSEVQGQGRSLKAQASARCGSIHGGCAFFGSGTTATTSETTKDGAGGRGGAHPRVSGVVVQAGGDACSEATDGDVDEVVVLTDGSSRGRP